MPLLVLFVFAAACGDRVATDGALGWLTDEYFATLPEDSAQAYAEHVRYAVEQEHGPETFVPGYADEDLVALAVLWCANGAGEYSRAIGDELRSRGDEINPTSGLLPPPPIDVLMTRIADRHQPQLCIDLGFG